jgi:hypothetical protein
VGKEKGKGQGQGREREIKGKWVRERGKGQALLARKGPSYFDFATSIEPDCIAYLGREILHTNTSWKELLHLIMLYYTVLQSTIL